MIIIDEKQFDYLSDQFHINPVKVYRTEVPRAKGRFYVTFSPDGTPILLTSGTTAISDGFADPEKERRLADWRMKLVMEGKNVDEEVRYAQDYGTILHILHNDLLMGKTIPFGSFDAVDQFESYVREIDSKVGQQSIDYICAIRLTELKKDIISFMTWVKDFNVKPLAIELMGALVKYKVGSAIDLICTIDVDVQGFWGDVYASNSGSHKKGDPKLTKKKQTVLAIIDYKSGKKGFYTSHILQLFLYRDMIQEQYGITVDYLYNYAPKDWRCSMDSFDKSKPYSFVRQDGKQSVEKYLYTTLEAGMLKFEDKPKRFDFFTGAASLNPAMNSLTYQKLDIMEELYMRYCPDKLEDYKKFRDTLDGEVEVEDSEL